MSEHLYEEDARITEDDYNLIEARAEVERLRAALEKIRDRDYRGNRCQCSDIARTALEGNEDRGESRE